MPLLEVYILGGERECITYSSGSRLAPLRRPSLPAAPPIADISV